jgi:site-specific recombinase XerD
MAKNRYLHLLDNPDVDRWYRNVARGSQVTADVYLRRLGSFCKKQDLTPTELSKLEEKELRNLLLDFVSSMEKKNYAGSYIESIVKAVRSWLSHNYVEIKGKIKIRGARQTPSLKDERVPIQKELKKIFRSGDKKTRLACVLVAHSGLRLKTLGNYLGNDGLRVRDFPELKAEGGTVEVEKIPTLVVVRSELSKAGHQYFTFLSEEGCEYLNDYLEERLRGREKIDSETPIITPKTAKKPFIRATNIGDIIRGSIRNAGFEWRPYVLRSYFATHLMLAESKGKVIRDYREFWMGHKGDIENRYTTNKQKLPENVIEDMRESYRESQEYLQTTVPEATSEERLREAFQRQLLLVAGFNEEEIKKMDLTDISDEEFQNVVRQRLAGIMQSNGNRQRVIGFNQVERYISEGWEYVTSLPDNKAIIKTPF